MRGVKSTPSDFWLQVDRSTDCWEWTGALDKDGYGRCWFGGRDQRAHRISLHIAGRDPGTSIVRHLCNNRKCVRPDHLDVGTISDNVLDEVRSGTHAKLRYKQELVDVIRQEYAAGAGSTRHLAHKHGVSKSHVHAICAGITRTVRVERRLNERD